MKVSIITPAYNSEAFLSETIESILAQDYADWEMVIVDDCSKDNSVDVQTALNHFMPMKELGYEGSMFPHIELPTREEQQKELSKHSLEL